MAAAEKPNATAIKGLRSCSSGNRAKLVMRSVPLKNNTATRKVTSTLAALSRDHAADASIHTSSGAKATRARMLLRMIDTLSCRETMSVTIVSTSIAATVASEAA